MDQRKVFIFLLLVVATWADEYQFEELPRVKRDVSKLKEVAIGAIAAGSKFKKSATLSSSDWDFKSSSASYLPPSRYEPSGCSCQGSAQVYPAGRPLPPRVLPASPALDLPPPPPSSSGGVVGQQLYLQPPSQSGPYYPQLRPAQPAQWLPDYNSQTSTGYSYDIPTDRFNY